MTGHINKFKENKKTAITMSLRVNNKQLLKNHNKIWKKLERLINIDFESKPFYGNNDDKYIKTKIKISKKIWIQIFRIKKYLKEKYYANVYQ